MYKGRGNTSKMTEAKPREPAALRLTVPTVVSQLQLIHESVICWLFLSADAAHPSKGNRLYDRRDASGRGWVAAARRGKPQTFQKLPSD
jgi:hypothetical protein